VRALVRRAANCFFPLNFLEPSAIDKAGEEEIPVTCSRDRPLKETLVCDKKNNRGEHFSSEESIFEIRELLSPTKFISAEIRISQNKLRSSKSAVLNPRY
jgi:hypothetical protein